MTTPTFRTWIPHEVVTAAKLNVDVKAAGEWARDAILALQGGNERVGATVKRTAPLALPDALLTTVTWDGEDEDTHGFWTSGGNLTVPTGKGGIYGITGGAAMAAAATGRSLIQVNVPGWTSISAVRAYYGSGEQFVSIAAVVPLSAGDSVSLSVMQDGAAATTLTGKLSMYRLSI